MMRHINDIIDECVPDSVRVIGCVARVRYDRMFTPDEYPLAVKSIPGGGGTLAKPVFDAVDTTDLLIYLTDGYITDLHALRRTDHLVIWIITDRHGREDMPLGEMIIAEG